MGLSEAMGTTPRGIVQGPFVLLLLIAITSLSAGNTYNISPYCLMSATSCYTLTDVVRMSRTLPFSDSKLIFSPGEHSLTGEAVAIANTENLTFVGFDTASVPIILCTNSSLVFSDVTSLRFKNLELASCGIVLSNVSATFENTTFKDGCAYKGGAIAIYNSSNVSFISQTSFVRNKAVLAGGAILSNKSTLSFSGAINFEDNWSGPGGGGAIFAAHSEVNFIGVTKFTENRLTLVHCGDSNITAAVHLMEVYGGGAVLALHSSFIFDGQTEFTDNRVGLKREGAGIYANGSIIQFTGHASFMNNSALRANGLYANHSNVSFSGTTLFTSAYNASDGGGAMYMHQQCTLTVEGYSTFDNNSASLGGALLVWHNNTLKFSGQTSFTNNMAVRGGAIRVSESDNLTFNGVTQFINNTVTYKGGALDFDHYIHANFNNISVFMNNTARRGGAIVSLDGNLVQFDGNHTFLNNSAELGGAINSKVGSVYNFSGDCSFINNTASFGAGIYITTGGSLSMDGRISFVGNNASYTGGGLGVRDSTVTLTGTIDIVENSAKLGGGVLLQDARLELMGSGRFTSNVAEIYGYGGAVFSSGSIIHFHGEEWRFVANRAHYGAAIALAGLERNLLYFHPLLSYAILHFEDNFAHQRGGAIYVEENLFSYCEFEGRIQTMEPCFMQNVQETCQPEEPKVPKPSYFDGIRLNFVNNTAGETGNVLHGGSLYSCEWCVTRDRYIMGINAFHYVANITDDITQVPNLSSDPFIMETCEGNSSQAISLYPMQTINISVLAHGQNGTTPTVVRAITSPGVNLSDPNAILQSVGRNCSELKYTLIQEFESVTEGWIQLYADKPCSTSGFPLTVSVKFLECPIGFTLSGGECHCASRLESFDVECRIQDQTILRYGDFWVGVTERNNKSGLVLHSHCPFDYCTDEDVRFSLDNIDRQCTNSRSGTLCGACRSGFSLALGSSRCLHCSNAFLALLIPFALAGILLVFFLFIFKITISTGTISGLLFYANILAINKDVFFPPAETNVLTVFIAWLNLDLGIEACFVDGLDAYSSAWLQFVFPVYLWLLVGLIILLANVSVTVAKLIGDTNPISVLATLFLVSYTKILRTIMATFLSTSLEYPEGEISAVWLFDGTVKYLYGKHAFLFLFSFLAFLFLFLPYSLVLLFGQWIEGKFQVRWIPQKYYLRLKALLDAHHAPFKDKHRYWFGLLLLLRFLILLFAAILEAVRPQDPQVILLIMLVTVSGLQMWAWIVHGAYKNWYLDALEASFMFNLLILIGGTNKIAISGGDQAALVYTSVGVAFVTFLGIISYFVWKHPAMNSVRNFISKRYYRRRSTSETETSSDIVSETSSSRDSEPVLPTFSVITSPPYGFTFPASTVALREPLLESTSSYHGPSST